MCLFHYYIPSRTPLPPHPPAPSCPIVEDCGVHVHAWKSILWCMRGHCIGLHSSIYCIHVSVWPALHDKEISNVEEKAFTSSLNIFRKAFCIKGCMGAGWNNTNPLPHYHLIWLKDDVIVILLHDVSFIPVTFFLPPFSLHSKENPTYIFLFWE